MKYVLFATLAAIGLGGCGEVTRFESSYSEGIITCTATIAAHCDKFGG